MPKGLWSTSEPAEPQAFRPIKSLSKPSPQFQTPRCAKAVPFTLVYWRVCISSSGASTIQMTRAAVKTLTKLIRLRLRGPGKMDLSRIVGGFHQNYYPLGQSGIICGIHNVWTCNFETTIRASSGLHRKTRSSARSAIHQELHEIRSLSGTRSSTFRRSFTFFSLGIASPYLLSPH